MWVDVPEPPTRQPAAEKERVAETLQLPLGAEAGDGMGTTDGDFGAVRGIITGIQI
jgi:hypothetical protein